MESSNSNSKERELQVTQRLAKQRHSHCMTWFEQLETHLRDLYLNSSSHAIAAFKPAFHSFFGEEHHTFRLKMFHNLDQLRLQLERENLLELSRHIRLVNDQVPPAEVYLTTQHNVLANELQHTDQSEPSYDTYLVGNKGFKEFKSDEHASNDVCSHQFRPRSSTTNDAPLVKEKKRCTAQCALSLEEEKSFYLRPFSSTSFMLFHARSVIKWINVPLIVALFTQMVIRLLITSVQDPHPTFDSETVVHGSKETFPELVILTQRASVNQPKSNRKNGPKDHPLDQDYCYFRLQPALQNDESMSPKRRLFLTTGDSVLPGMDYFISVHPRSNVRFSALFLDTEEKSSFLTK
ncbi:hypothetical protein Tco_1515677 [Tanacetum coccineum]